MKRINIYAVLAVLVSLSAVFAQSDSPGVGFKSVGQSSMNFLQVSVVPRATALGGAYTCIGKGVESIFYNPAGLAESENKVEIFFSATNWIADINYLAAAACWNLKNMGSIGISFVSVDYGDLIGTSLVSASDLATDVLGYKDNGLVSDVGAYAFGVAYSRRISDAFLFGGGVRYVGQQLGQNMLVNGMAKNDESKVVVDLGVKYYTLLRGFGFAMSIRNFSNTVKYEEISSPLPLTFAVGCAIDMIELVSGSADDAHSLLTAVEFSHPNNYTERIHVGIDYSLNGLFSTRVGYITNHDIAGLSFGVGIIPELMGTKTELSYSYSSMNTFDDVSRISLKMCF